MDLDLGGLSLYWLPGKRALTARPATLYVIQLYVTSKSVTFQYIIFLKKQHIFSQNIRQLPHGCRLKNQPRCWNHAPKRAAPGKINKEINNIIDGNIKEGRAETNKVSLTRITSSVWFLKMRFINSWINKKSKLINDWVSPLYFVYMSVTKSTDSWINGSDDWLSISETFFTKA